MLGFQPAELDLFVAQGVAKGLNRLGFQPIES